MRPVLAITMGDPGGIGPEIIVKALSDKGVYDICSPVVIGDYEALSDALRFCGLNLAINEISRPQNALGEFGRVDLINLGYLQKGSWEYKKISRVCGLSSFGYIRAAVELALSGAVRGVVTAPISKESINKAGINYSGHTEIFADLTRATNYGMLLTNDKMRVIHVTTHVSLEKACKMITTERTLNVIKLADEALKAFGVKNPRIAVAGLNPHAGENGLFGNEEETIIKPAVAGAQSEGILAEGPFPPDTVFAKAIGGACDVVVAMYHDQGHIPFKLSSFRLDADTNTFSSVSGVNCTVGLPVIRTSVDHGTAFDIAGEGRASEESMIDAIKTAVLMAKVKFRGELE